jgi:hypothetical protein
MFVHWSCYTGNAKIGVWLSASLVYGEAFVDIIPPVNRRHLLEIGMGVDVTYRRRAPPRTIQTHVRHGRTRDCYGFPSIHPVADVFRKGKMGHVVALADAGRTKVPASAAVKRATSRPMQREPTDTRGKEAYQQYGRRSGWSTRVDSHR